MVSQPSNPGIEFKDSDQAFDDAIRAGRLSDDESRSDYAGNFMYMGTHAGVDLFKNIDTREYLRA